MFLRERLVTGGTYEYVVLLLFYERTRTAYTYVSCSRRRPLSLLSSFLLRTCLQIYSSQEAGCRKEHTRNGTQSWIVACMVHAYAPVRDAKANTIYDQHTYTPLSVVAM